MFDMSKEKSEAMMEEADRYLDFGDYTSALSKYTQILEIDPGNDEAYAMMGSVYGELGNSALAMTNLSKALNLNPENADAWLMQGIVQKSTGNKLSAIQSFKKAVIFADDYDVAHFNLGQMLLEEGDYSSAVKSFNQAVICNPKHVDALYLLGTIYQLQIDHENALKYFYKVIEVKNNHINSLRRIPIELLALNKEDEAESFCLTAIKLAPSDPWLYKNLADVKVHQGQLYEAMELARKAMNLSFSSEEFILQYANLVEKYGDYEEVLELLRPMLESNSPVYNAVILFSKFSPYLDMNEQAKELLRRILNSTNLSEHQSRTVNEALSWVIR